jgi:Predicted periplasmic or secreted lipoprotein
MNNRDQNAPRQPGGSTDTYGYRDQPRQTDQWQASSPGQAGSDWDYDDNRSASYRREEGRSALGLDRNETRDRNDAYARQEREYRLDSRYDKPQRDRDRGDQMSSGYQTGYPDRYYYSGSRSDFSDFTSEDYGGRDFYASQTGSAGGMRSSGSYRPSYGPGSGARTNEYGDWRQYGESRGFFERAGDQIASWFGDEDAARRREQDHRGRGPSDYTRSDERIREDINDNLTHDWRIDASHIRVTVKDGEATLDGHVDSRHAKRRAEDLADDVTGVRHVQNNLRVQSSGTATTISSTAAKN